MVEIIPESIGEILKRATLGVLQQDQEGDLVGNVASKKDRCPLRQEASSKEEVGEMRRRRSVKIVR